MQISLTELLTDVQNLGYGAFILLCFYPILGAMIWFWGATSYHLFKRDKGENDWRILQPSEQPFVTIMIPAHNEEVMLESTITYLFEELNYTNFEVLVLNDGSTDRTKAIILELEKRYPRLRMLEVVANKGKAHAFNIGTFFAKGDYLLSNDADTVPEPDALMKYMNYFIHDADLNTAAVTANMDVANRTTLLGKSQTVEFSSIVGVIKRSQTAINDSMYAYSGANTLYRKSLLMAAGGFRQDRATEDISIAWDHQMLGAVPRFAPNVIFHMNVPETVKDLFHQRQRWAQGGTEVWLANFGGFVRHPFKHRYQFSMFIDTTLSVIWAFFFMISTAIYLLTIGVLAVNQQWSTIGNMFQYSLGRL
ncbi:glycosyltransferase [Furfurilactobacillus siliginis]|nr:glycosyltransferase family 2 protein [Furfurilactobacillus siliginis]